MMQHTLRQPGLVGPLLLLGLGSLFLLSNFGTVGWSVWEAVFRLWPLVLIALGVDILIGRRSTVGALIAALVRVAMFAAVLFWFTLAPLGAQPRNTQSLAQPYGDASRADLSLNLGAGSLMLGALDGSTNLLEGTVALNSAERLAQTFSIRDHTAYLTMRSERTDDSRPFLGLYAQGRCA